MWPSSEACGGWQRGSLGLNLLNREVPVSFKDSPPCALCLPVVHAGRRLPRSAVKSVPRAFAAKLCSVARPPRWVKDRRTSTSLVGVSGRRTPQPRRCNASLRQPLRGLDAQVHVRSAARYCKVPLTSASKAALSPLCWAMSRMRHRHNPANITAVRSAVFLSDSPRGQSADGTHLLGQAAFSVGETVYVPVGSQRWPHVVMLVGASGKGKASNGRIACPWASVMRSWASSENPSLPCPSLARCCWRARAPRGWAALDVSAQFLGHSAG